MNNNEYIIIFTVDSPLQSYGGLGETIRNLCVNLQQYTFLSFGCGKTDNKDNIYHTSIDNNIHDSMVRSPEKILLQLDIIENVIKNKKIKVIHVFDWMYASLCNNLSKKIGTKWIFTLCLSGIKKIMDIYELYKNIFPENAKQLLIKNEKELETMGKIEQFILENADNIIFISQYYRSLYPEKYKLKYEVILSGIDFNEYSVKVKKNKYEVPGIQGNKKILYLGRFDTMKNITFLVETPVPEGIDLIIAGSSQAGDLKWLENILDQVTIPNIFRIEFLRGEKKKYFLQNVDAVIVPSIHEPFGLVALEAIASKTILICSRSSGMREYISKDICIDCGMIPESISNAYTLFMKMTENEKEEMKERALESVKHLTWTNNVSKYEKIYNKY